jgi:hypothetical protein
MRYGHEPPEAPTYLGKNQLPLPPEWLRDSGDEPPTSAAQARARTGASGLAPLPPRVQTERSDARPALVSPRHARSTHAPAPEPAAPALPPKAHATPAPALAKKDKSVSAKSASKSASASASGSARSASAASASAPSAPSASSSKRSKSVSAPPPAEPGPASNASNPALDPAMVAAAMSAIDPMQIPVPPELAGSIYSWIRRLALQADLHGADRVLRDALLDLTSSLSVSIVYPGAEGLWSLGNDDEIPRDAGPIIAVAQARKAIISSHTALVPVITSSETVAVVLLTRNPRNPAYHPVEQVAMIALARESAAILHHLAVQHIQRQNEIKQDKGALYRAEALEAHRSRGTEGAAMLLSPSWTKIAYPLLIVTILVGCVLGIVIHVPTYSTGTGMVVYPGTTIAAPAGGTVDEILVKDDQEVKAGQVLIRLHSEQESAELAAAQREYDALTQQYLFDGNDQNLKAQLATAITRVDRARAAVDLRIVRARRAGTVSDIRVHISQAVQPGEPVLQIVAPGTEPEVVAFLPGRDRPRLRAGQTIQIELEGYKKTREFATISNISSEVIGGNEAAKYLGITAADQLKLQNTGESFVIVHAKLPTRTFQTEQRTYRYHHGMVSKTEVKVRNQPFVVTLLPALEKYLPD